MPKASCISLRLRGLNHDSVRGWSAGSSGEPGHEPSVCADREIAFAGERYLGSSHLLFKHVGSEIFLWVDSFEIIARTPLRQAPFDGGPVSRLARAHLRRCPVGAAPKIMQR